MSASKRLIAIFESPRVRYFLKTADRFLVDALRDNPSVLEFGCGPEPAILRLQLVDTYIGVDAFKPSIERASQFALTIKPDLDTQFVQGEILEFARTFNTPVDYVVSIDVIEHLPKSQGDEFLRQCFRIARKGVIVVTPNGYVKQAADLFNPWQEHKSGWTIDDFLCHSALNENVYETTIRGGSGPRFLRHSFVDRTDTRIAHTIRFRPRILFAVVCAVGQLITYRMPRKGFHLYVCYRINPHGIPLQAS
jgi:hypothetical protein